MGMGLYKLVFSVGGDTQAEYGYLLFLTPIANGISLYLFRWSSWSVS